MAVLMLIAAAVSFSCSSFGDSFGDPLINVKGTVKDAQGNLVENATVTIQGNENGEIRKAALDQIAKADGVFDFGIVGKMPANAQLIIKKEGFKTFEKNLASSQQSPIEINAVLESQTK